MAIDGQPLSLETLQLYTSRVANRDHYIARLMAILGAVENAPCKGKGKIYVNDKVVAAAFNARFRRPNGEPHRHQEAGDLILRTIRERELEVECLVIESTDPLFKQLKACVKARAAERLAELPMPVLKATALPPGRKGPTNDPGTSGAACPPPAA